MIRKVIDNDELILNSPDSLNHITKNLEEIFNKSLSFYKLLFNVDNFRKITINYFDDIDEFRNFIYSLRGESATLPSYATGTFDNGMINAYIDPNITKATSNKIYLASHELFHIMYKELVWGKNGEDRIVWFDEGMAQLFSGEHKNIIEDNFDYLVKSTKETTKVIPNLNNLNHGKSFVNDDYNGYRLSLLTVKYIYDIIGFNDFKNLIYDNNKIREYGNIVAEIFEYYGRNKRL